MRQTFKTPNRRVKCAVELSAPNGFFQEPVELSEPTIFQEGNYEFQKFEAWLNIIFTVYETHPAGGGNFHVLLKRFYCFCNENHVFRAVELQKNPPAAGSQNILVELSEPHSPKIQSSS